MADTLDVTDRIEQRDKPRPPGWPEPGTPEYAERIRRMRAGHQKRLQKSQEAKRAAPVEEPDLIDTGEPNPVRMAPEAAEKGKPATGGKRGKAADFDEAQVREYIQLGLDCLASLPGHEHWHREADEVRLMSVPGTRILNRLDKQLLERLRSVSDPAALVFGCVMVLGPSLLKEVQGVQRQQQQTRVSGRQPAGRPAGPQSEAPREAHSGSGGAHFPGPAGIPANGAAAPAPVSDLSPTGI